MKELLIPVGNFECLKVAVFSGADAVYLGGKKFGARAYANNFDEEEMIKAIKFCHLYGVKIYVTVNTLIHEGEMSSVIEYVKFLHTNGVDAIIVQDLGLIKTLRQMMPNLEIHASTQVHTTNERTIKFLEDLGVNRIVYAREVSVDSIDQMNTPLEKEAFIHGALCISYSGECLASSILLNRSGNRGECAGLCRLPYKLKEDDKIVETNGNYLLSTKELNTSPKFERIINSSIYSLKVEGRMKSPEYVGCVTKLYRDLLDKAYNNEPIEPNSEYLHDLTTIYNREYTCGFLFNSSNEELMNIKSPNHLGTYLGTVTKVDKKYIYIKIKEDTYQGDGIRFIRINEGGILNYIYNDSLLLTNKCLKENILIIDNKYKGIKIGDIVNKTLSTSLIDKYTKIPEKKININMSFKARLNKELELSITDGINHITVYEKAPERALKTPTSKDDILNKLLKLGNTPFKSEKEEIDMEDNLFINISTINKLRQEATTKLIELRENVNKDIIINSKEENNKIDTSIKGISILVRNKEQMEVALSNNITRIYTPNLSLYNMYKNNKNVYFRTSRIGTNTNEDNLLITELGNIKNGSNKVLDYYLNITNHESINFFSNYAKIITLSVELTQEEITNICSYYNNDTNLELIIYGTLELMLLKYCPLNLLVNKDKVCKVCLNNKKYYLIDRNDKEFRILQDYNEHLTHIMDHKYINNIDLIPYYKSIGINNFRIELLDESSKETENIIKKVKEQYEEK